MLIDELNEQKEEALSYGNAKSYKAFKDIQFYYQPKKIDTQTEFSEVEPEENVKSSIIL